MSEHNPLEPIYCEQPKRTPEMQTACLYDTIVKSRELQVISGQRWSMGDVMSQLLQEGGEFSEQVMIANGKIPYKEGQPDGVFLEAADVFNCVIDAVAKTYPSMSPAQILARLAWAVDKKNESWAQATAKRYGEEG